jgi:hypothetical protein
MMPGDSLNGFSDYFTGGLLPAERRSYLLSRGFTGLLTAERRSYLLSLGFDGLLSAERR